MQVGLIAIPRPYRYLHVGILSCLHSHMNNLILFGLLFWYFFWLWQEEEVVKAPVLFSDQIGVSLLLFPCLEFFV